MTRHNTEGRTAAGTTPPPFSGHPALYDALAYLRTIRLPPHQMERLGLDEDWAARADPVFVARVLELIERYRPLLEELARH